MISWRYAPVGRPAVSVAIPNYNYGRYLESAVRSALTQDGVQVDVTIIDDASDDTSTAIAQRLAALDDRVQVVRHASNHGHIRTFNEALGSGQADYIVKLDSDDLLSPGSLARSAALLDRFSDVSFVYGNALLFSHEEQIHNLPIRDSTSLQPVPVWQVWSGQSWLRSRFRRGRNVIAQPEVMIRRSALEMVGGHLTEIPAASDFNLWLRLATVGRVAHINGTLQGYYRLHDQSMQRTIHAGVAADLEARQQAFELFFRDRGDHVMDADFWQAQVRRTLARDAIRIANIGLDRGELTQADVCDLIAFARQQDAKVGVSFAARMAERRGQATLGPGNPAPPWAPGKLVRDLDAHFKWRRLRVTGK